MTKNQATSTERMAKARRTFWAITPVVLAALLYGVPKYLAWADLEFARASVKIAEIKGECVK